MADHVNDELAARGQETISVAQAGRIGGRSRSAAKLAAILRNLKKANAARKAKHAAQQAGHILRNSA